MPWKWCEGWIDTFGGSNRRHQVVAGHGAGDQHVLTQPLRALGSPNATAEGPRVPMTVLR